jgi:hypothetical protein
MSGERDGLVDKRVVELADTCPRGEPEPDPECLPTRPARAQPAGGGTADATLELGFARVERVAECRIPGKRLPRDGVQLEQPAQKRPSVLTREVTALDERNRVREVGQREAAREPRTVRALGGIRRGHELRSRVVAEPPSASELLHRFHALESRGRPATPNKHGSRSRVG